MMRPNLRSTARALFAASVLFSAPAVMAQPAPTSANAAAAQTRFDRGRGFYERNDFANALPEFRASLELFRSPNTRLYIGLCLTRIGQLGDGYAELQRTLREANDLASTDRRYESTRALAQRELDTLTPRIARMTVQVPSNLPGLVVRVGSQVLPAAAYGVELPYTPGEVTVRAEAPGHTPFTQSVRLSPRAQSGVNVMLQRGPGGPPATTVVSNPNPNGNVAVTMPDPDPSRVPPPVTTREGGGVRVAGIVVASLGVVGLGLFGAFGTMAGNRYDDLLGTCRGRCPSSRENEIAEGEQYQTIANVSLGVGAAAVVAGVVMIAAGGPRTVTREQAPTARRWQPFVDAQRGMLGVAGAF